MAKRRDRITRRVLMGAVLAGVAIYWLAREMDLDPDVLLGYLGGSVVLVAVPLVLAFVAVAVYKFLRR